MEFELDKDVNPKWYELAENSNRLTLDYNSLNAKLVNYRLPKFLLFGQRKKLAVLAKEFDSLQKRVNTWVNETREFCMHPKYNIKKGQELNVTAYQHLTFVLWDFVREMENAMIKMFDNLRLIGYAIDNRINFIIAMISFLLGFVSFVVVFIQLLFYD